MSGASGAEPAGTPPSAPPAGVDEAIRVIGYPDDGDWTLTPSAHAERYRDEAPDLASLLSGSRVRVIAESYRDKDARALERQARFDVTARRARSAVFWAGVSSAVLLAGGGLSGVLSPAVRTGLVTAAAAGAVVASALGAMWIRQLKEGKLLEGWMTARAGAESERLRYFGVVAADPDAPVPNLRLEYFRRYQLDVQRAYYRGRGDEHRRTADRALSLSSGAMAVGVIACGLAGAIGAFAPVWTSLAAVGLAAQAWAARVTNEEATAQNRRNAERYERTRFALDRLYERLDEVRAAVARGHTAALTEYVGAVHEQLSLEHRQWLEDTRAAGTAAERLETLLSRYREEGGGPV